MKAKIIEASTLVIVLMSSCAETFYQVYKAVPSNNIQKSNGTLVYEDDNCSIIYSLWAEYGSMSFRFYNKTDENIFLNLGESFFIQNGLAYDYFQNRTYTNTTTTEALATESGTASKSVTGLNYLNLFQTNRLSSSSAVGVASSKGYSIGTFEEEVICIPAKSSKIISEFSINEILYRDCNLLRYPSNKKQIRTIKFTSEDSPLKFSNRLVYFVGKEGNPIKLENLFFITEITNYPEDEISEYKNEEFCGEKGDISIRSFKEISPDKFYIKYSNVDKTMKH